MKVEDIRKFLDGLYASEVVGASSPYAYDSHAVPASLCSSSPFGTSFGDVQLARNEYEAKPPIAAIEQAVHKRNRAKDRSIRLFVSSTFKDMQAERNLLVKKVFPQVRKVCIERNVNFTEVDLRWGITNEESSGGQVITLCLNEIDNCRPYMIGMLGERYGWAKVGFDKHLDASFKRAIEAGHAWVEHYTDRSVTELEILYAALFYPHLAQSAAFYLRDPDYSHRNRLGDNEPLRDKLDDLKQRIRASGLPARENYKSPDDFADLVLKDLLAWIDRDFPPEEQSASKDAASLEMEVAIHDTHCTRLSEVFVGGDKYFAVIEEHVRANDSTPLILTGPTGSGKSSLIASWVAQRKGMSLGEQELVIPHFIELSDNSVHRILGRILGQLKSHFKLEDLDIPSDPEKLIQAFPQWLAKVAAAGSTRVVIALDGVNHVESSGLALNWLPSSFPSSVRVILSVSANDCGYFSASKSNDESAKAEPTSKAERCMEVLMKRAGWGSKLLRMVPLTDFEKQKLIEEYLGKYSKKLSPQQTYQLVEKKMTSLPLFLRSILEQLRIFGNFEELSKYIDYFLECSDISSLFEKILTRWEADYNTTAHGSLVQDVCAYIFVTKTGLLETELLDVTLAGKERVVLSHFLNGCQDAFVSRAGLITFGHSYLRKAVKRRYRLHEPVNRLRYHQGLAAYLGAQPLDPLTSRLLFEYPRHLVAVGDSAKMRDFLSSLEVFAALYTDHDKYDFLRYWNAVGHEKDKAGELYRRALLDPTRRSARSSDELLALQVQVAQFLQEMGDPNGAVPLLKDALAIAEGKYGKQSKEAADLLHDLALAYELSAQINLALEAAEKAHGLRVKLFGDTNEDTASSVWLLALLHKKKGNYDEALKLYYQALDQTQARLGPNHPTVGQYVKTVADVYRKQAVFDKAQTLYHQALAIFRINFGNSHPQVAEILSCLALILKKKGQYEQAKPLYLDALKIVEEVYGEEHVLVAEISNNLADVYRKIALVDQATDLYLRAARINEKNLGSQHPELAENFNALGLVFKIRGKMTEAEEYVRKAIAIIRAVYGDEHQKLAIFINNLADVLSITAKYDEAKQLYAQAMAINTKCLGADHPEVSENLNSLGMIAKKRGQYDEAESCYRRSLAIIEKVYGPDHPKAALYVHNLGVIARKKRNFEEARECYSRALELNEKILGKGHPLTGSNLNGLGLVKRKLSELDEAADLHQRALSIFETRLGYEHKEVALTLNYLAEVYRRQGKYQYDGAERLYERALAINRATFKDDHPEIAENLNGLAQVYKNQFKYDKAEDMFLHALDMSERLLGKAHPHVLNRYSNLLDCYEKWGRVDKAAGVERKLVALRQYVADHPDLSFGD